MEMIMESYGRSSISEFLGNRIVYRNLTPYDRTLPSLEQLRNELGVAEGAIPRKNEPDYARVIVRLLQASREQDRSDGQITRLIFIGDTRLLDGTAFANLCEVSGWPGLAFIGAEDDLPPSTKVIETGEGNAVMFANRWSALKQFERFCKQRNHSIGEGTAVVIDMDKTMVGARGRNGQVIDQARMDAVRETISGLLGDDFDPQAFRQSYEPLNQPEFHPFTGDNQDYLAYICLVLGSGLVSYENLISRVRSGIITSFREFLEEVERRKASLPSHLAALHDEIHARVQDGDPTPFKAFRRNEYKMTLRRFGCLDESAGTSRMLAEEIVITEEVRRLALEWRRRGALLFGLSDKPDEASTPSDDLANQGFVALHQAVTHSVGEAGFTL
jgi:hypothetical protein